MEMTKIEEKLLNQDINKFMSDIRGYFKNIEDLFKDYDLSYGSNIEGVYKYIKTLDECKEFLTNRKNLPKAWVEERQIKLNTDFLGRVEGLLGFLIERES